jgi:hypothetical protein
MKEETKPNLVKNLIERYSRTMKQLEVLNLKVSVMEDRLKKLENDVHKVVFKK